MSTLDEIYDIFVEEYDCSNLPKEDVIKFLIYCKTLRERKTVDYYTDESYALHKKLIEKFRGRKWFTFTLSDVVIFLELLKKNGVENISTRM